MCYDKGKIKGFRFSLTERKRLDMKIKKGLKYLLAEVMAVLVLVSGSAAANAEPINPYIVPGTELSETVDPQQPDDPGEDDPVDIPFEPEQSQVSENSEVETSEPEPEPEPEPQPVTESSEAVESSAAVIYEESSNTEYPQTSEISRYVVERSHVYVYDENNDHYQYSVVSETETSEYETEESYESYEEVSVEPERDTSALDISDYEMSDTIVLTPQDWEQLKKANQGETSQLVLKASPNAGNTTNAFKKLKEESKGGNDDWIFLMWGIILLSAGVIAVGAVIVTTVITKKKRIK